MKLRYILLSLLVLVVAWWWYDNYSLKEDKKRLVIAIENHKKLYQTYPVNLNEIAVGISHDFNYKTDSLHQSFRLSYLSGFMDLNSNYYESEKGYWQTQYTE